MGGVQTACDFNATVALGHRLRGENCETLMLARRLGCFMSVRRAGARVLLNFARHHCCWCFIAILNSVATAIAAIQIFLLRVGVRKVKFQMLLRGNKLALTAWTKQSPFFNFLTSRFFSCT